MSHIQVRAIENVSPGPQKAQGDDRALRFTAGHGMTPHHLLQLALAVVGAVFLLLYPLAIVWPAGWAWHAGAPYASEYFIMIVGVYATLGLFLINAARNPLANGSLIWFTIVSNIVHSVIMAVQSFGGDGHMHIGHLVGDVPALLLVAGVLAIFYHMARRAAAR